MNYIGLVSAKEITYLTITISQRKQFIRAVLTKYPDIMNGSEKSDLDFMKTCRNIG